RTGERGRRPSSRGSSGRCPAKVPLAPRWSHSSSSGRGSRPPSRTYGSPSALRRKDPHSDGSTRDPAHGRGVRHVTFEASGCHRAALAFFPVPRAPRSRVARICLRYRTLAWAKAGRYTGCSSHARKIDGRTGSENGPHDMGLTVTNPIRFSVLV